MLAVTILGNNSAVPAFDRHPTSQVITMDGTSFLIDCGEGTQIQMINYKIRRSRISHIFISHLHGDHYFGLVGLITSFSLLNHQQELNVYAPYPLQQIIELQLKVADIKLCYQLNFHTIKGSGLLLDSDKYFVHCFRTNHRIECYGFFIGEKRRPRKLIPEKAAEFGIPKSFYRKIEEGSGFVTKDNQTIKNEWVTTESPKGKTYAFCADTKYDEAIIPYIKDADMIYHETTYLDHLVDVAESRFHSTSKQAALIARKANVKRLLIGHFSSKYAELDEFETEAKEIFDATEIAREGVTYRV